jgi:hypothetical protein
VDWLAGAALLNEESSMAKASRRPSSPAHSTAGKSPEALLDDLLPLIEPAEVEMHRDAAVLEVDGPARLLEMAADPAIRTLLLCRLGPRAALVDCGRAEDLAEILRRRGHTPKIVRP